MPHILGFNNCSAMFWTHDHLRFIDSSLLLSLVIFILKCKITIYELFCIVLRKSLRWRHIRQHVDAAIQERSKYVIYSLVLFGFCDYRTNQNNACSVTRVSPRAGLVRKQMLCASHMSANEGSLAKGNLRHLRMMYVR